MITVLSSPNDGLECDDEMDFGPEENKHPKSILIIH